MTAFQIQDSTKTRIRFQGESQKVEDRILVIRGTQDAVHQAELMVRKVIVDQPPIVSGTVNVPANSVGRIIGKFFVDYINGLDRAYSTLLCLSVVCLLYVVYHAYIVAKWYILSGKCLKKSVGLPNS